MDQRPEALLSKLDEIEELLRTGIAGHLERVERLLVTVARNAPAGEIIGLAMKAVSAASLVNRNPASADAADALNAALSRLRVALLEAETRGRPP